MADEGIEQFKKELLGEILIRRKIITPEQLDQALTHQQKEGGHIGSVLVKLGFVEEKNVVAALVVQCNFPYIAIDKYDVDTHILLMIPAAFARSHCLMPLDRVGNIFSVVMANPLDQGVKAELQRLTGCSIAPFIATRTEITQAIDRCYGKEK